MTSLVTLVTVVQSTTFITVVVLLWACIDAASRHLMSDSRRSNTPLPEKRGKD